ncbi:M48 family metallopeptidase [Sulfitobacter albidus]|uniref:M48 family metallopeptidase n=1 Tax=Sulfitobacter albidus TaxID=2829501 RepID=A0A975JC29_9RHOB|nr:M48 family metallopeptidase [Sulfitobacter albidus]QUJ75727.1 M48 family metallopeptidase [Sulfitobacter albidus]
MTDLPSRPPPAAYRFDSRSSAYFDGDVPLPRDVALRVDQAAGTLEIAFPGGEGDTVLWPLRDIRRLDDIAGNDSMVLRWTNDPMARLHLRNPDVARAMPHLTRRAPPKGRLRLAAWAGAAVLAVALQIGVLIPLLADRLAVFVPPAGERALGEATFAQIRQALAGTGLPPLATCDYDPGLAALDKMVRALGADPDAEDGPTVFVLDHEMVNAFALPGGFVVFFDGLIDAAESPNEVAAVMAHELGHVVNRDPTRHALRSAGSIGILGLMFGDFAGGAVVLFLTEQLISARYAQDAETGADTYAYGALEEAGISPAALGDMFARLRDEYGDTEGVVSHFVSHPTLGSRIDAARAAADPDASYGDILTDAEWANLKAVCD